MPDAFDMLGEAVTTDRGTIYDYPASAGEAFAAGVERALDTNPLALGARALRTFSEDFGARFGGNDDALVSQEEAQKEIASRGLDLKVPVGGITRYELDTLQYLKQREVRQNTVGARADGVTGVAAGFAGAFAGSFADPINVASNFIPFVSEYRYARWLGQAGTSTLARAAVRAKAGAIEGAAGAAVIEPLVYAGATSLQLDYDSTDSFLNVTLGGVMGGGLHMIGGAVYDARVSKAMRGLDQGLADNAAIRDALAAFPEMQKRELFQASVAAIERGGVFDVSPLFEAWHASPHVFDQFDLSKMGTGEGAQAFGKGLYLAGNEGVARGYRKTTSDAAFIRAAREAYDNFDSPDDAVALLLGSDDLSAKQKRLLVALQKDDWLGFDYPHQAVSAALRSPENFDMSPETLAALADTGVMYRVRVKASEADFPIYDGPSGPQAHEFAEAARARGAPGIRYLDRGSRRAGEGTYNYVVFDDRALEIVSRNGEPVAQPQATPRDLSGLIQQSRADRTQEAFNRQFVDDAEATIAKEKARPKDKVAAVQEDEAEFRDIVEEYRGAGLTTADDDARLKQADDLAAWAARRAKAFEAAAGCMETT